MKKKTLKKWKGIVGIGFGLAVAAGLGVLYWKIPDNRPWQYVILEAGAPLPQPEDFLIKQGRFKHLFKKGNEYLLEAFQKEVDRRWDELLFRCSK